MARMGDDIGAAADCLSRGLLVGIPTETVYGLAANALDERAVAGIFEAKQRPHFDPLIVHIGDATEADRYAASFPEAAQQLAAAFWPGPLTLILPKKPIIPDLVTSGQPTVGLRVPAHPLTRDLLRSLPFPLAAPSANPFGYVSPTTAQHVNDQLGDAVCYILDGGPCDVGVESTIVGFENDLPVIYRLGGIPVEQIAAVVGEVKEQIRAGSNPVAPGQTDAHYSPRCRLLLDQLPSEPAADGKTAMLRFSEAWPGFPEKDQLILSENADLTEAATRLFGYLRLLDEQGYRLAYAESVPDHGIGRAINDRLKRASALFH